MKKLRNVLLVLGIIAAAGVAIMLAQKLYDLRDQQIAPAAPEKAEAEDTAAPQCKLVFVVASPTPGPTNTPAPTSTPGPTATLGPTVTPEPTAANTPTPTNTPAPGTGGEEEIIYEQEESIPTRIELPRAGAGENTIFALLFGGITLGLGLLLAL